MSISKIVMVPIGVVSSPRVDLGDHNWGAVESIITIDSPEIQVDRLLGLDTFSHLEVVFHFHRVPEEEVERGARPPRGRADWPLVGILAQRAKSRPNRIGVSRCRLRSANGRRLRVMGLDAVDKTPVLDIKPYFLEFQPIEEVRQPPWSHDVMRDYCVDGNRQAPTNL
jgi:tRNA (adenine37-N6)-methyltransferase